MNAGRSNGSKSHTRSLHIKLPGDHPVFSLPDGERSRVAREWVEQGRQILTALDDIKDEIAEIKKLVGKGEVPFQKNSTKGTEQERKNPINPAVFLNL